MPIISVKMTNPEADSRAQLPGGGRYENVVDIYWKMQRAEASFKQVVLPVYCASMRRIFGYGAPQPSKFNGMLKQVEVFRHAEKGFTAATPKTGHSVRIFMPGAKSDCLASACVNLKASMGRLVKNLNVYVESDLMLGVYNANASPKMAGGKIRLWLE